MSESAFPTNGWQDGLTLRDYFAAKWLQGFIANPALDDMTYAHTACKAYEMADAMLKARDGNS